MSFYFDISTENKITYNTLVDALGSSNVRFKSSPENMDNPITGAKIYIPGKSTRGITISKDKEGYSIGINVVASEDDFRLAIDVAKAIGVITKSKIKSEDSEELIDANLLADKFDQKWIDTMKTLGVSTMIENVGRDGSTLTVGGCYMQYNIGPKIHELLDDSSELNYYQSLIEHIKSTQFFDLKKYQIASVMIATSQDGTHKKSFVVFYPEGNEFLSYANYVVFPVDNGKYEISYDMVSKIANAKFRRVDENQYLIDSLSSNEYQAIIKNIEFELNKETEDQIQKRHSVLSDNELNDEFRRTASIPKASSKVFALKRMVSLMAEYEKRNIAMPTLQKRKQTNNEKIETPVVVSGETRNKPINKIESKPTSKIDSKIEIVKPWWKFW